VGEVREIEASEVAAAIEEMAAQSIYHLGKEEFNALRRARDRESSEMGRAALDDIIANAEIADKGEFPICQDTGLAVVFIDWGQDAHLVGGTLEGAVNEGVRRAQRGAYMRASVVGDPFERSNTGDNTPAIVHLRMVEGDSVRIQYAAKGGGAENMSRLAMLKPADGAEGLVEFVVGAVREASANPCPPVVVGVAVGGDFEQAAVTAKRTLLRPLGEANPDAALAELERRILEGINATGVGPSGLGGEVTALAVHLEAAPCHLASMPVAVNIDCHAHRHREVVL
jgi:fumarate hydratase subunit alpha